MVASSFVLIYSVWVCRRRSGAVKDRFGALAFNALAPTGHTISGVWDAIKTLGVVFGAVLHKILAMTNAIMAMRIFRHPRAS
jgi:hypothetical protein